MKRRHWLKIVTTYKHFKGLYKFKIQDQHRPERVHEMHGDGDDRRHKQRWLNIIPAEELNNLLF